MNAACEDSLISMSIIRNSMRVSLTLLAYNKLKMSFEEVSSPGRTCCCQI